MLDLEDGSCLSCEANPSDEKDVAGAPVEKELLEFALNDLWRMCSDDPHAALEVISSIDKSGPPASPLLGMHMMRSMASGRDALRQYRKNGKVLTQEIERLCECSLSELRQFRDSPEEPSVPGDWAVALGDFERLHIDEIAVLLEKDSPGRVHDLLGYTKLRYLTLSYQLFAFSAPWVIEGENDEILRAIGDIHLSAQFPIRSAELSGHVWKELKLREVCVRVYSKTLQADRLPPLGANRKEFRFSKDMRMRLWSNKPVNPDAYGRWVLTA
jgi:hypothetical protein